MVIQLPDEPVGGPGKSIGFIFPVYYNGLPRLVKKFVRRLDILPGTYCFAFINSGGSKSNTLGMLEDILQEKGISLSYAEEVTMPGNYIVNYQAPCPDEVQNQVKAAEGKVDKAGNDIANGERQPVREQAKLWSRITNQMYLYKNIAGWDEKFIATSKCTGCGQCMKVCPVDNIIMADQRPVWQHHCERCLACLQWCPCEAIEYGAKTIGRRRYRNPNIKVEEIMNGYKKEQDRREK